MVKDGKRLTRIANDQLEKLWLNFSRSTNRVVAPSFRVSTGFEPVTSANTGAMLYQLSYEATHWEPGYFCGFYLSHEGTDWVVRFFISIHDQMMQSLSQLANLETGKYMYMYYATSH